MSAVLSDLLDQAQDHIIAAAAAAQPDQAYLRLTRAFDAIGRALDATDQDNFSDNVVALGIHCRRIGFPVQQASALCAACQESECRFYLGQSRG